MNSRERIELFLCNIKENTVIEASRIYTFLADDMTEAAFYKTLERFCQSGSLVHLTKGLYYKPKKSRFGIVPIREQDIVVDESRAVAYLYEDILGHHAALQLFGESRALVVMQQILR